MSRRVVLPAVTAVMVVIAAVAGWLLLRKEEPRPAMFHAESTSAFYATIATRQADAAPLTVQEVFTPAARALGKLTLDATAQFDDCDDALQGVSADGCTQALRATYKGEGMAGQFVIFNLGDGRAADALVAGLSKDGFVRQGIPFDAASSQAQVRAMGHYVTVSWAGGTASADDLVQALVALDGLGQVVQTRVVAAG